ncbi:MAG: hypothetical protein ACI93T_002174 [Porticoccaceae bacterium]|jgi:hypothetical protein
MVVSRMQQSLRARGNAAGVSKGGIVTRRSGNCLRLWKSWKRACEWSAGALTVGVANYSN